MTWPKYKNVGILICHSEKMLEIHPLYDFRDFHGYFIENFEKYIDNYNFSLTTKMTI